MCEPTTALMVASMGIKMVGAVGSYNASMAGADVAEQAARVEHEAAQADYQNQVTHWQNNIMASWAAARDEGRQLLARELEEQDASAVRLKLSRLEEAEARASGEVAAAAAGVGGISVNNILSEITGRSAMNRAAERRSWRNTAAQFSVERGAVGTRARSRINAVPTPVAPHPGVYGVRMAAAGVQRSSAGARLFGDFASAIPTDFSTE